MKKKVGLTQGLLSESAEGG